MKNPNPQGKAGNRPNILYTGDNLYFLHGMDSETVDLIYLDPPFNSKRLYKAPVGSKAAGASFKDMWTWQDVDESYLDRLVEDYPYLVQFIQSVEFIHGKPMMAYLTYMTQRIIEMRRILKPTGTIYLHCDPTASHYLKILMDRIFGKNNFREHISWKRALSEQKGSQFKARSWGGNTDIILFYAKSGEARIKPYRKLTDHERARKFRHIDEQGKRYYLDNAHIWRTPNMGDRPNLCYEWRGFRNPHPAGWRLSKERLEEEYQKGNFVIRPDGKLERRKYEEDYPGRPVGNFWDDIRPPQGDECTGYPTQKPLALMHRIIESSSSMGDLVLDPFAGRATTCVAAQQTHRRWIGMDISEKAAELVVDRLSDEGRLFTDFMHLDRPPVRTDLEQCAPDDPDAKARLFKEQDGRCNACGVELDIWHFEIDHVIPRSKNGGDYYENYQLLCAHCNRTKGDRPMEYLRAKIKRRNEALNLRVGF